MRVHEEGGPEFDEQNVPGPNQAPNQSEQMDLVGLDRFKYAARHLIRLSVEEQEALFAEGAAMPLMGRQAIAESYTSLAIGIAFDFWKNDPELPLDDLIGRACQEVMISIGKYAGLPADKQRSFAAYFVARAGGALKREAFYERLKTREISGWEKDDITEYVAMRRLLAAESLKEPGPREIAEKLNISIATAIALETASRKQILYDGVGADGESGTFADWSLVMEERAEFRVPETSVEKAIAVERGLALIAQRSALYIRLLYGIDSRALETSEIAQEFATTRGTVQGAIDNGRAELAEILPQIFNNTFDYNAWAHDPKNAQRRSALSFLPRVGIEIPPLAPMEQLRGRGLMRVHLAECTPYRKEVVVALYGLATGQPVSASGLARQYGVTPGAISGAERHALAACRAVTVR